MKNFLAFLAAAAAMVCHAQASSRDGSGSNLRESMPQQRGAASAVTPRQPSAQERAQLRRQLAQCSRLVGRGS